MAILNNLLDPIFGKSKKANTSSQEAAQADAIQAYLDALQDYQNNGLSLYENAGELTPEMLANPELLGQSALYDIVTNPEYQDYTLDALAALEGIANDGFSAADLAEQAKSDSDINRQQAGAIGAARQNMAQRGMSGSGMDLLTQLQIAQSSADQRALSALERQGQAQTNRQNASLNLGNLANNLQSTQFSQEASKAAAQDAINKFNNQNKSDTAKYNNQLANNAAQLNLQNKQNVANSNTEARNTHSSNALNSAGTAAGLRYNQASDSANRAIASAENSNNNRNNTINTLIGGGATIAGALLSDERAKENVFDQGGDDIESFLDSIAPREFQYKGEGKQRHGVLAQDLEGSRIGQDMVKEDPASGLKTIDVGDAIGALLQSVSHLHKKVNGRA